MLDVTGLNVTYPTGKVAVHDVTFTAQPGQVLALLGGNGAGKSTTLKVAAGVIPATTGTVTVSGYDTSAPDTADQARARVGYCPDVGGLPPQLTVRECIALALATTGQLTDWPAAYALADRFDLTRVLDERVGRFSHGMARRTSALLAVLTARDVLILDEPFDGVDVLGVQVICEAIHAAANAGLAVVVSTHLTDVATKVATRAVVLRDGSAVAEIPTRRLRTAVGRARYRHLLEGTR